VLLETSSWDDAALPIVLSLTVLRRNSLQCAALPFCLFLPPTSFTGRVISYPPTCITLSFPDCLPFCITLHTFRCIAVFHVPDLQYRIAFPMCINKTSCTSRECAQRHFCNISPYPPFPASCPLSHRVVALGTHSCIPANFSISAYFLL
jgi:hypothetical protein